MEMTDAVHEFQKMGWPWKNDFPKNIENMCFEPIKKCFSKHLFFLSLSLRCSALENFGDRKTDETEAKSATGFSKLSGTILSKRTSVNQHHVVVDARTFVRDRTAEFC